MASESTPASFARSKLEFMYRDMLSEAEKVMGRNAEIVDKLHETSISLLGVPKAIQAAATTVSEQASIESTRQLQEAARSVAAAERSLRKASRSFQEASTKNIWLMASFCALSAFFGGLLSALICAAILIS